MQVLRALSIAAAVGAANGAFACEIHSVIPEPAIEAKILALLNEPVLLNRDDPSQGIRLQLVEAGIIASANEPVLLNRDDLSEVSTWEHLDPLPNPAGLSNVDLQHLRVVVDDEGIALMMDVAYTGSTDASAPAAPVERELAIDGYEDR
jgi:hypothetical protein